MSALPTGNHDEPLESVVVRLHSEKVLNRLASGMHRVPIGQLTRQYYPFEIGALTRQVRALL